MRKHYEDCELMYGDQSLRQKIDWKTKRDMVRECGSRYGRSRGQQRRHP